MVDKMLTINFRLCNILKNQIALKIRKARIHIELKLLIASSCLSFKNRKQCYHNGPADDVAATPEVGNYNLQFV